MCDSPQDTRLPPSGQMRPPLQGELRANESMLTLQQPLIKLHVCIPKDALVLGMGTGMGATVLPPSQSLPCWVRGGGICRLYSGLRQEHCAGAMREPWVQGAELKVLLYSV